MSITHLLLKKRKDPKLQSQTMVFSFLKETLIKLLEIQKYCLSKIGSLSKQMIQYLTIIFQQNQRNLKVVVSTLFHNTPMTRGCLRPTRAQSLYNLSNQLYLLRTKLPTIHQEFLIKISRKDKLQINNK